MADKVLNTRVQQKHDIEANWLKATNFIPKIGEVIVYDPDETHEIARVKIGDGEKTVGQLPFISEQADWNVNDESSAAYVKNRTHYSKLQENTVFEINFTGEREYYLEGFVPVTGQTYFVYLNGERYECVANEAPGQAGAYWNYIGSLGIETLKDYQLDDRYPFFFGSMFNNPNYCCICFKEAGEYQFIIKTLEEIVVKQLDEKFIPDTIARVEDILTPVQSDWNTNDENDLSYVKNRTHYIEVSDSITFNPNNETLYDVSGTYNVEASQQYEVIWDGEVYNCTAVIPSNINLVALGNSALYNYGPYKEDTGEPFGMIFGSRSIMIAAEDASIPHTFSITGVTQLQEVVHQLDPKFIPTASEEQLIQLLMDIDALPAMTDSNGAIFTHKDSILLI